MRSPPAEPAVAPAAIAIETVSPTTLRAAYVKLIVSPQRSHCCRVRILTQVRRGVVNELAVLAIRASATACWADPIRSNATPGQSRLGFLPPPRAYRPFRVPLHIS